MGRGSMSEGAALSNASWSEAARARASQIDVEHVLAGIAANGGEAARILGQAGVTLAGIRAATRRVRDRHLATLGVDPRDLPSASPRPLEDLHHDATGDIPMSERFKVLTKGSAFTSGTALLRAVIDEPSGRGREVLAETGADVEVLSRVLDATDDRRRGWRIVPVRRDLLGDGPVSRGVQVQRFVSAPPQLVADVAAGEEFAAEFVGRGEKRGYRYWPDRLAAEGTPEGHHVLWGCRFDGGKRRLEAVLNSYTDISISPAPGGAEVTVTVANRRWGGPLWRIVGPLVPWVMLARLRAWQIVRGLAMGSAEAQEA